MIVEYIEKPQGKVLAEFYEDWSRVVLIMGPLGCLRGDMKVRTSAGLKRIDSLTASDRVLSYDQKLGRFLHVPTSGAYRKGEDYLYRVSTPTGEFVAAAHHRVLCADGRYRQVDSLSVGDVLSVCDASQNQTIGAFRERLRRGGQRLWQTNVDFQGRCVALARRYGQQPLAALVGDRSFVPSLSDVRELSRDYDPGEHTQLDAQEGVSHTHIHPNQCDDHLGKRGYSHQYGGPCVGRAFDGVNLLPQRFVSHALRAIRSLPRLLRGFFARHRQGVKGFYQSVVFQPLFCSATEKPIIDIERLKVKNSYWDISVPGTNNYVTEDWSIHHNSGKTIQTCQKIFDAMCTQAPNDEGIRPSRWVAIRNTYPDLTTTTIKDWRALYGDLGRYVGGGLEPPTHFLDFDLEDGTTVQAEMIFIALDRADAVKKLRGSQVTGFWLNEVKELSKPVVDMADLRHGRYPSMASGGVTPSWHGMVGDTNAPDEDHWYYRLAEQDRPEGWSFHRQPGGVMKVGEQWGVNPDAENLQNLPPEYYLRGMQGKSDDWIKINLANEYGFVANGKPVYPEYVDSVHCLRDEYQPDIKFPIILGMDFGRTPACAFIQYNPGLGRYVGFDEFVTEDMSASSFAPELKKYLDQHYSKFEFAMGGGDPSGDAGNQATDETPFKILRAHGIKTVRPTETNDPLVRRSAIINPMKRLCMDGKPAFMISPKCKQWRKGLQGGFCYKRIQVAGDEKYHDKPDKNQYSHVCEAGEYALQAAGEGRAAVVSRNAAAAPFQAASFDVF